MGARSGRPGMPFRIPGTSWEFGATDFHGASHKFIAERSAEMLGRNDVAERARQLYVDWRSDCGEAARPASHLMSTWAAVLQ